jgi:hypothetical protein
LQPFPTASATARACKKLKLAGNQLADLAQAMRGYVGPQLLRISATVPVSAGVAAALIPG